MPDLQAQATALRADGHKLKAYVTFFVGQEVAEFEGDTAYIDTDYPLTVVDGAYNSGSASDVGEGFLVEIRRAAGQLRRVTRTRYGATQTATALHIRELSRAESVTGITDLLTIRREVRISDKLVEATSSFNPDGIAVGTFNSNPPPIANSGGLDVGFVDSGQTYRSVQFFGNLSFTVDPDSSGTVTHVWTIPTGGGSFAPGSASTDANPTIRVNVGHWLIQHVVTDSSNSVATTQYIMVVVHDRTSALPYDCVIEPLEGDKEDGWGYRVQIFEDATETDIPDGSYAFVWVEETINGTAQSFGSPVTGRSHIKAVGIIRREETREDGSEDSLTFDIISPLARLGETPGFSKVMERNASPDAWSEIAGLKTLRGSLQLIQFYCNLNNAGFDVIVDDDMPSYDYPLLFLQKDSPLGQIRELTTATQGRFICDRRGRFMFIPVLNLMTRTARNNRDTQFVFTRDDIIDIQVSREHWRPIETFRLRGFTASIDNPNPVFARYPGNAPGQGNQSGSMERIICQNTAQAYFFCGLYGAMEDGWFTSSEGIGRFAPKVTITTPGSYDVLDFYGEWIEFNFSLTLRGIDLSAFRYELQRASVTYESGTAQCVFELQAETFAEPGTDDTPPPSDTNDLVDWTDIWGTITFPTSPALTLLPGDTVRIGLILHRDYSAETASLYRTEDGSTFTETTFGSLGVAGLFYGAQQDPFDLTRLWVLTDEGVGRITDVGGTPAYTEDSDLGIIAGDVVTRMSIHTERKTPNLVVVSFYLTNVGTPSRDGHYIARTTDGTTWTTYKQSTAVPGYVVWCSAHNTNYVYVTDTVDTSGRLRYRVLRSTSGGAEGTFSAYYTMPDPGGGAFDYSIHGLHVPFYDNSDDDLFYFSHSADVGGVITSTLRRHDGGSITTIDAPNNSSSSTGGFEGMRGMDSYVTNSNLIAVNANRFAFSTTLDPIAGGLAESSDAGANWIPTVFSTDTLLRHVAISGDNQLVRWYWGQDGELYKTTTGAIADAVDISGDLPGGGADHMDNAIGYLFGLP